MQNTASIVKCIYEDEGGAGGIEGEKEGGLAGDVMKRQQAAK